jgi:hypothetical protein
VSSRLDAIKNKVKNSSNQSVHGALIDTDIINDDKKANSGSENVNVHVNVNVDEKNTGAAQKREKKKRFEELYSRDTIWIKNDLKGKITEECEGERGEKTRLINEALEEYFKKRNR